MKVLRATFGISAMAALSALACGQVGGEATGGSAQADVASGTYALIASHSGKCIDVTAWNGNNGTKLEQWDCTGNDNQAFVLTPVGGGQYEVKSVFDGKCLDITDWRNDNGAPIQQWDCAGTANQHFWLVPKGNGHAIQAVSSGKCVDVTAQRTDAGAPLQQWDCWWGPNQTFALAPPHGGGGGGGAGGGGGTCSAADRAHCNCPTDFSCCPTDGSCFKDPSQVVYTMCKDDPARACSMGGSSGGGGGNGGGGGGGGNGGGGGGGTPGPTRLRVASNCAQPIWIAHSDNVPSPQNVMLQRGQSYDYSIPDGGLASARFWPKTGCDGGGHACAMGDNGEGGGKPCPAGGCQPPLDSKFEVSFAANGSGAETWYNLSQVDGYTLPFKVTPAGAGVNSGSCVASDCGGLSLDRCPGDENMSGGGAYPGYAHEDLRVRDASGKVIACMAPCKKWNYPAPYGLGQGEGQEPGLHMCCPTPIDPASGQCTEANHCMTSQACNAAADPVSVVHTSYVAAIHAMCPSAYSFAYDDAAGLHACPSTTSFVVTFCP